MWLQHGFLAPCVRLCVGMRGDRQIRRLQRPRRACKRRTPSIADDASKTPHTRLTHLVRAGQRARRCWHCRRLHLFRSQFYRDREIAPPVCACVWIGLGCDQTEDGTMPCLTSFGFAGASQTDTGPSEALGPTTDPRARLSTRRPTRWTIRVGLDDSRPAPNAVLLSIEEEAGKPALLWRLRQKWPKNRSWHRYS